MNYLEPRLGYNKGRSYSLTTWRKKVLDRDKSLCQNCFNAVKDPYRKRQFSNEAHHVVPRRHGGKNTVSNGITLCKFCHHYFDYMYSIYNLDYFQLIEKPKEVRIKEVRELMKIVYFKHVFSI